MRPTSLQLYRLKLALRELMECERIYRLLTGCPQQSSDDALGQDVQS